MTLCKTKVCRFSHGCKNPQASCLPTKLQQTVNNLYKELASVSQQTIPRQERKVVTTTRLVYCGIQGLTIS
jgi:hypothetical protein